jgi:hypothetical protein
MDTNERELKKASPALGLMADENREVCVRPIGLYKSDESLISVNSTSLTHPTL